MGYEEASRRKKAHCETPQLHIRWGMLWNFRGWGGEGVERNLLIQMSNVVRIITMLTLRQIQSPDIKKT